jgi:hypothetical protein
MSVEDTVRSVEEYRRLRAQALDENEDHTVRLVAASALLDKAGFVPWSRADLHALTRGERETLLARIKAELSRREALERPSGFVS